MSIPHYGHIPSCGYPRGFVVRSTRRLVCRLFDRRTLVEKDHDVTTNLRGVIWDMDGTLIDSADYHYESWKELLGSEGVDLDYPAFLIGFGRRNDEWLRQLLGEHIALSDIQRIGNAKEARYREMIEASGLALLPGVLDTLVALRESGWRLAVATSAPVQNLDIILDVTSLRPLMDGWAGSEDVQNGKPAPDVFLAATDRIVVAPDRAIVVEDAAAGVQGARRAGMRTIGVGPHHAELGADRSVESLVDLPVTVFSELISEDSRGH